MSRSLPDKIIENSEDDGDSDSPLEELTSLLMSRTPENRTKQTQGERNILKETSSFLTRSMRTRKTSEHHSPLENKARYKYDLKSLAKFTQSYDSTEASSNRAREMLEIESKLADPVISSDKTHSCFSKLTRDDLLNTVEDCVEGKRQELDKIRCVIERTGDSSRFKRWYFFHSQPNYTEYPQKEFPISSLPEKWRSEMRNPEMRRQAFISGFFENIVIIGNAVRNDIYHWLIDEVCWQKCDVLRNCYFNVLTQSFSQIQNFLSPEKITNLFLNLNGTLEGTNIKIKIQLVDEIPEYYSNQDWSALLSTLKFFSKVAGALSQNARTHLTCILLRMSVDIVILKNVDIFYHVQNTLDCLCNSTSATCWKQFCQETCESVFQCTEQPTLRLQIVESLSSVTARSHDLKRRLASCFLFNNLIFAKKPSQDYFNFPMFLNRLKVSDFNGTSNTDYCKLRALIMLMDIAVDNGKSSCLNLDTEIEKENFNNNVDNFSMIVKEVLGGIGTQDNGSISKIQAKEAVEAFYRRITHTMRTKPKAVHEWFIDHGKGRSDLGEKQAMERFVSRVKGYKRED